MTAPNHRRDAWRLFERSAELETLYENNGGEVTEVAEEMERRIEKDSLQVAEDAAAWLAENAARISMMAEEKSRLSERVAECKRNVGLAKGWLLKIAELRDEKTVRAGQFEVRTSMGREIARETEPLGKELLLTLRTRGLASSETTTKVDLRAVLRELKAGANVPGFELARGAKGVSVR